MTLTYDYVDLDPSPISVRATGGQDYELQLNSDRFFHTFLNQNENTFPLEFRIVAPRVKPTLTACQSKPSRSTPLPTPVRLRRPPLLTRAGDTG